MLTQQTHEVKHLLLNLNPISNSVNGDKFDSVSKSAQATSKSNDNISEFSFKSDETAVTALTSQTTDINLNKSNGLSSNGPESHSIANQTSNTNDSNHFENIKVIFIYWFYSVLGNEKNSCWNKFVYKQMKFKKNAFFAI